MKDKFFIRLLERWILRCYNPFDIHIFGIFMQTTFDPTQFGELEHIQKKESSFSMELYLDHLKSHLSKITRFDFLSSSYLLSAFTHKSFLNENREFHHDDYERLEFLGDSLLNTLVTIKLFDKYPEGSEGELSRMRSAIVNQNTLATLCSFFGLHQFILLGAGEMRRETYLRESIQSDIFEAILAAIYLSSDFEKLQFVFNEILLNYSSFQVDIFSKEYAQNFDPKTTLSELSVKLYQQTPVYHSKRLGQEEFEVGVYLKGNCLYTLTENSKKEAEKKLAKIVLDNKLYKEI